MDSAVLGRVTDRNAWLTAVFAAYVAFLFVFAAIYYYLYRKSRFRFSFNHEVQEAQSGAFRTARAKELERLSEFANVLRTARTEVSKGSFRFDGPRWFSNKARIVADSGYVVECEARSAAAGPGGAAFWRVLTICDPSGKLLVQWNLGDNYSLPETSEKFVKLLDKIDSDYIKKITDELDAATAPEALIWPWSYWDFVYFSTITQSTVGYGDILPNSTSVRMVVVMQVLVGYALLIVILNLVFAAKS